MAPFVFTEAKENLLVAASSGGKMLAFPLAELPRLAKGRGVSIIGLEKSEKLVALAVTRSRSITILGAARGKPRELTLSGAKFDHYVGHRALKGRVLPDKLVAARLQPPP